MKRQWLWTALIPVLVALSGCQSGGYVLQGRAVEGEYTVIEFVDADDERLRLRGVSGVKVVVHRDPSQPNSKRVADRRSSSDGSIQVPVKEFGAGWMTEQWLIEAQRQGYETAEAMLEFPRMKENRRLLIMLHPGLSSPLRPEDELWEQYEQFR